METAWFLLSDSSVQTERHKGSERALRKAAERGAKKLRCWYSSVLILAERKRVWGK